VSALALSLGLVAVPWIVSPYTVPGMVAVIDVGKLAVTEDGFRTDISEEAEIHMDDAPLALATGTSGATAATASPTTSLWQQSLISCRLVAEIAWAWRGPAGAAYIDGVNW